jgi:hypothetical protein
MQVFIVWIKDSNLKVVVWASGREDAKNQAHVRLYGIRDEYVVEPVTNPNDRVMFDLNLGD